MRLESNPARLSSVARCSQQSRHVSASLLPTRVPPPGTHASLSILPGPAPSEQDLLHTTPPPQYFYFLPLQIMFDYSSYLKKL
jgi:hypothetical protein